MITLYGFGKGMGVLDPSPFVLKTHTYLRMAKLDYKVVNRIDNLQKAPKGKLPFIEVEGQRIADSSFIIDHLIDRYQITLDDWLSEEQKALAFLLSKALEEHLYWCMVWMRWVDPAGWEQTSRVFFGKLPLPLRLVVPRVARSGVIKACKAQGTGRHLRQEILNISERTLKYLAVFLADKSYMLGDKPCSLDATGYGFLAQLILTEFNSEVCDMARQHDNLVAYCHRMQNEFFTG